MDFLDVIHGLFKVQDEFPNMAWEAVDGQVEITIPVGDDNVYQLNQGILLFE